MKVKKGTIVVSIILIALTLGLDQLTKWAIQNSIDVNTRIEVIKHLFYLTYLKNTGAAFSMFEGFGMTFFSILTIIALIVIVYVYVCSDDYRMHMCLTLIFSGAIGNFIDRLTLGYVRDFFSVYIFGYPFPVFNVADICITLGFAFLIVCYVYDDYKEKKRWKQESSE